MDSITAPNEIKSWLECLFWFCAICAALVYLAKILRGPAAVPANESLAIGSAELARRVAYLESENAKVWVKMEADARKLEAGIHAVDKKVEHMGGVLEMVNNTLGLINLKMQNLRK